MYLTIACMTLIGLALGLRFGTRVYDSKLGTACGVTLCVLAFGLLVWQLFLLPLNYTPLRVALALIVLVMQTCSAGEWSRRNAKPSISVRQGILAMFCICVGAACLARFYSL